MLLVVTSSPQSCALTSTPLDLQNSDSLVAEASPARVKDLVFMSILSGVTGLLLDDLIVATCCVLPVLIARLELSESCTCVWRHYDIELQYIQVTNNSQENKHLISPSYANCLLQQQPHIGCIYEDQPSSSIVSWKIRPRQHDRGH